MAYKYLVYYASSWAIKAKAQMPIALTPRVSIKRDLQVPGELHRAEADNHLSIR